MTLKVEVNEKGTTIKLDNYELENIIEYKLEGSVKEGTELTIKMSLSTN